MRRLVNYSVSWLMCIAAQTATATDVVIAGEDDWPPYSSAEHAGQSVDSTPSGFSSELIRAAFLTQGVKVRFITVPFARCMLLAQQGLVAGCFNASITPANHDIYYWHQPPMFEEEISIFGLAEGTTRDVTLKDLRGKRVGITNAYVYPGEFMNDPTIERHTAKSDANLVRMLLANRLDYILLNRTPGWVRIDGMPEARGKVVRLGRLGVDAYMIAFSRKYAEGQRLADTFGKGLAQMRKDGSYQRQLEAFRARIGYR